MQKIRLTIAIPTFNGARYIIAPLNSIKSQLENNNEKIEVLIADNCSDDVYQEIVNQFNNNPKFILNYYRHKTNIGFDQNVDFCIRMAQGLFVWLLADDDVIEAGGILKVLDTISKYEELSILFVNDYSLTNVMRSKDDLLCRDGNEFFYNNSFKNGLMSSNIISKQYYSRIDASKYFGTGWIHFGVVMEMVQNGDSYIISYPYVKQGIKMSNWGEKGQFIYFGLSLIEIMKTMNKFGYNKKIIREAYNVITGGYKYYIPFAKSQGLDINSKLLKRMISLYKKFPLFWMVYLPILLLPNRLYEFVLNRKFCIGFKHLTQKIGLKLNI